MNATEMGKGNTFLIETYKGWNKMHDPSTDSALNVINYGPDDKDNQSLYAGMAYVDLMRK